MDNRLGNVKKANRSPKSKQKCSPVRSEIEQIFEASNDFVRIINSDFTIRYINHTFAEMAGVNQDDVVGKKCWEVFPSPLCHTPDCRATRLLNGEEPIRVEIERQNHDGITIPCIVTTSLLKDNDGNITGVVEQFRDITEQRCMKEQVKEFEERYRAMLELGNQLGEGVIIMQDIDDKEGIQIFVNEQWVKMTGYEIKTLLGTCFFDLVLGRDKLTLIEKHRQQIAGKLSQSLFETQIIREDGTALDVEIAGTPIINVKQRASVIYIRDITNRKRIENRIQQSEQLYRGLFENVPVAISEHDFSQAKKYFAELRSKGVTNFRDYFLTDIPKEVMNCRSRVKVTRINKPAMELWGIDSNRGDTEEDLQAKLKQMPTTELCMGRIDCYSGLAEGKTHFDYDEYAKNADGEIKYLHSWVSVAPGCENDLSKVYVCFVDITERKKAEIELKEYQNNLQNIINERTAELTKVNNTLQQQMQQRIEFTRAIVHEIKTPLSSIMASSEALLEGIDESKVRLARNVFNGSLTLNKRVDELFDLLRGEIGMLSLNYSIIDPLDMIENIAEQVSQNVKNQGQSLLLDVPSSMPQLWADPDRLNQVIFNLLSNALKFNRRGGKITLRARVKKTQIEFEIQDEGIGIATEDKELLFQPYKRIGKYQSYGGLGMGLALSKAFVELHHGQMSVKSELGYGSTFSFSIPLTYNNCPGSSQYE
jgi:PAS domain S-box-containing protein